MRTIYDGATDASYLIIDFNTYSTDASGYFIIGTAAVTPDITQSSGFKPGDTTSDAVALYLDLASNFPNGTAVTAASLIDEIVYTARSGPADAGLLPLLIGGTQLDENVNGARNSDSIQRVPDGAGGYRDTTACQVKAATVRAAS